MQEFLFFLVRSLNPANYKDLVTRKKRHAIRYFLLLVFFSSILTLVFNIPRMTRFPEALDSKISKVERFNITGVDISIREPITLLERPRIVLDLTQNKTISDEALLITETDIYWKKPKFEPFQLSLFRTKQKDVTELSDVVAGVSSLKNIYGILILLLLPSFLFIMFLLKLFKYGLMIILFMAFGLLLKRLLKAKLKPGQTFKAVIFSLTVYILLDSLRPLINLGIIPFIIYAVFFFFALSNSRIKKAPQKGS